MPPLKPVPTLKVIAVQTVSDVLKGLFINDQVTEEQLTPVIDHLQEHLPQVLQTDVVNKLAPCIQDEYISPNADEIAAHLNNKYLLLSTMLKASIMWITKCSITPAMKNLNGANIQSLMINICCENESRPVLFDSGVSDQELNSSNRQDNYLEPLYGFLLTLTNLTKLVCSPMCNTRMLQHISKTCQYLEEISLYCYDIEIDGLLHLAGHSPTEDSYEILRNGGYLSSDSVLRKLKKVKLYVLSLCNTITPDPAAMLLHFCPEIQDVDGYISIGKALISLHGNNAATYENVVERYSLKTVSISSSSENQVLLFVKTCPRLENVKIIFGRSIPCKYIFDKILSFPLKKLDLSNCDIEAFLWYLHHQWTNLSSLTLRDGTMTRTQLKNVIRACPNLQKLKLKIHELVPDVPYSAVDKHLSHFQAPFCLHLSIVRGQEISGEDLIFLVGQCQHLLEWSLNDEIGLEKTIDTNAFHNLLANGSLKNLCTLLVYNLNLTLADLWIILNECPRLHTVGDLATWAITDEEYKTFSCEIKKNNWDLKIVYTPVL